MNAFIAFTVLGLVSGAAYAIAASGLVLTYATTRIFNVAHGAIGMVMAFVYWELAYHRGLPQWAALLLVVGVIAPLSGALIERYVMRPVAEATVGVTLVVTVGLLVALIGLAQWIWPPTARSIEPFFPGHGIHLGQAYVSAHNLLTIGVALVTAIVLYAFLTFTRTGVAMRAAVDGRELLALHGGRPGRTSALAWAIGSALAALAGILLAPVVQLDYYELTLLVIGAYAAAMLGRLTSLPKTFIGALILGLLQSYTVGYLPNTGSLTGLQASVPTIFLFAAVLLIPHAPLRIGRLKGIPGVRVPTLRRMAISAAVLLGVAWFSAPFLSTVQASRIALAFILALVALSLVPLMGFGGYVSLAQYSFVGVGAVVVAKLHSGSPLAILLGALVAAAVGVLVALPTIRLQGLYLALSTLAFAQLMDKLVFQAPFAFGYDGALPVKRLDFLGLHFADEESYVFLASGVFVVVGVLVLALRRGSSGRLIIAMRDSPAACATLGLNPRWTRAVLFGTSAGIAGLAGGLFGGLRETVGASDFQLFNSLPLLLLAVVCGVTSVSGAAIAGFALMLLPILQSDHPSLGGVVFLVIGIAAVALGREPNGVAGWLFDAPRVRDLIRARMQRFTGMATALAYAGGDDRE